MSILPSDGPTGSDSEPKVIGVDSEDADDVFGALSAETARNLLAALNETPAPPGELADRVDTSLQNAQYHLQKLEAAGAVEVIDTAYSEKGREMDVYAPANQPLLIYAGEERETSGIRSALSRLLGAVGALAFASLIVQHLFGRDLGSVLGPEVKQGAAGAGTPAVDYLPNGTVRAPAETVTQVATATPQAADVASGAGIPLGLLFFAGGAVILLGLVAAGAVLR